MKEKGFLWGIICLAMLLCLTVVLESVVTARYATEQFQAVLGNIYEDNPETAKEVLESVFEKERTGESVKMGQRAAVKLGYTEDAYVLYYRQSFPGRKQIFCMILSFVLTAFLCVLAGLRYRYVMERLRNLYQRIQLCQQQNTDFVVSSKADGEWISLEYEIKNLIEENRKQKDYFIGKQEQMQIFMENIAHQIKTPLACILLNLEILQEKTVKAADDLKTIQKEKKIGKSNLEKEIVKNREEIEKTESDGYRSSSHLIQDSIMQGERIHTLLSRLLKLARMEAGKIHFLRERIEVDDILQEIQSEFPKGRVIIEKKKEDEKKEIREVREYNDSFEEKMEGDGKDEIGKQTLMGDRQWLFEAFFNLVDNSVKYSGSDAPVLIEVTSMHESVKIAVVDFGVGIPEKDFGRIFERYYVGNTSDSFRTGIGLNLTKQIILRHHGWIRMERRDGEGTRVEVRLPKISWKEKVDLL